MTGEEFCNAVNRGLASGSAEAYMPGARPEFNWRLGRVAVTVSSGPESDRYEVIRSRDAYDSVGKSTLTCAIALDAAGAAAVVNMFYFQLA